MINIQDEAGNDETTTYEKGLEDHTLGDLLLVKQDYDEVYGKGLFVKYIGKDIIGLLGLEEVSTGGLKEIEVQNKKSFAQVLREGSV